MELKTNVEVADNTAEPVEAEKLAETPKQPQKEVRNTPVNSLSSFLHPIRPAVEYKDVIISERFTEDGTENTPPIPFKLHSISQAKNNELIRLCTKKLKNGDEKLDNRAYQNRLMLECVEEPNFSSAEMVAAYGVQPMSVPETMLNVGEYQKLGSEILDLLGISTPDEDFEEALD
jgi:hypothetical protein